MKKMITLAITLLSISQQLSAASFSAVVAKGTLNVAVITDDCNSYSKKMSIVRECSNNGTTRECHAVDNIKVKIVPMTRKHCSGKKASIFRFDLSSTSISGNYFSLTLNDKEEITVKRSNNSAEDEAIDLPLADTYRCVETLEVNNRCRMIGGCRYLKVSLFKNERRIESFTSGSQERRRAECRIMKDELED